MEGNREVEGHSLRDARVAFGRIKGTCELSLADIEPKFENGENNINIDGRFLSLTVKALSDLAGILGLRSVVLERLSSDSDRENGLVALLMDEKGEVRVRLHIDKERAVIEGIAVNDLH